MGSTHLNRDLPRSLVRQLAPRSRVTATLCEWCRETFCKLEGIRINSGERLKSGLRTFIVGREEGGQVTEF